MHMRTGIVVAIALALTCTVAGCEDDNCVQDGQSSECVEIDDGTVGDGSGEENGSDDDIVIGGNHGDRASRRTPVRPVSPVRPAGKVGR